MRGLLRRVVAWLDAAFADPHAGRLDGAVLRDAGILTSIAISIAITALKYFLTPDTKVEGPRRDDLSATPTQPGSPIPRPIGVSVCPGQVIWQTDLIETKTSETSGSKGGPSTTATTYTYSVDIAYAFSSWEIESVSRIKLNEKTVWGLDSTVTYSAGEVTALADAVYDEVYAKRLAFYQAFGYESPEILAANDADAARAKKVDELNSAGEDTQIRYDDIEIFLGTEAQSPSSIIESQETAGNVPALRGLAYVVFKGLQLADFGNIIPVAKVETNTTTPVAATSGNVALVESDGDKSNTVTLSTGQTRTITFQTALEENDLVILWLTADNAFGAVDVNITQSGYVDYSVTLAGLSPPVYGAANRCYAKRMGATPDTQVDVENDVGNPDPINVLYLILRNVVTTGDWFRQTPSTAYSSTTHLTSGVPDPGPVTPVTSRDGLLILASLDDDLVTVGSLTGYGLTGWAYGATCTGMTFFNQGVGTDLINPVAVTMGGNDSWQAYHLCVIPDPGAAVAEVLGYTNVGAVLRKVMTDWTPDVSPLVEDTDFSIDAELDAMEVVGLTLTQNSSARDVYDMLRQWKPIEAVETGSLIKFIPRDSAAVALFNINDYRAASESSLPAFSVESKRVDDAQLPKEIREKYLNINRNFSGDGAYTRRVATRSNSVVEIDLPIVGTPSEAKRAVVMNMSQAFAERRTRTITLPPPYLILEGSDVVNMPLNNGDVVLSRIKQIDVGADFTVKVTLTDHVTSDDDLIFAANDDVDDKPGTTGLLPTVSEIMDLPMLETDRSLSKYVLYAAVGGQVATWAGSVIYEDKLSGGGSGAFGGTDVFGAETNFVEVATSVFGANIGVLGQAPSSTADEFIIDRESSFIVTFSTIAPNFSTLSDAQFITTVNNVFAVGNNVDGWEIIQAQVATELDTQTFEFSTLRRGMLGTETLIGSQSVGDSVVHLDSAVLQRLEYDSGQVGKTITYRAVTVGADIAAAADLDVVIVGRPLIPFAPDLARAYRNATGDIAFTLNGRARVRDGDDGFDSATIEWASEDYEVDIFDASSPPAVIRTISLTATSSGTYTSAQQVTDFGADQLAVVAKIYALDDAGARGYSRSVIL